MNQYNVALRVNYNGRAVSSGAARNAQDLSKLQTATSQQGRVSAQAARQNTLLARSYGAVAAGVSAYAVAYAGIGFTRDVAESEKLSIRIKNLTTSYEENLSATQFLAEASDELNVRYSTLAGGYSRFLALQKAGVQTSEESQAILRGLTNASKELGAANAQVAQTIFGYSQAATQGTVQTTELLQVTEPLPGLLQNMDKAAGFAAGGFRQLTGQGKVTSQFFKETLIKALGEYEGAAAASANTIDSAAQRFGSTYDRLLVKLQTPVNAAVVPVINAAKDSLELLGDNVDVLGDVATGAIALSAVLAGRLAASVSASSAAFVKNRAALQAKLVAERAASVSALNAARTQAAYAVQLQAGAKRQLEAARTDYARASAINNLALRNGQAIAAQNALTAATTRYNAAAKAASIASRGLGVALGLLGGPIGIITTAALAFTYFGDSANDAQIPTDELTASVNDLTEGYKQLTQTQLKARNVRLDDQLDTFNERIKEAKASIRDLRSESEEGFRIAVGVTAPVSEQRKKAINDEILLQEAELERLEQSKTDLLNAQVAIKERIASGAAPDKPEEPTKPTNVIDFSKELERLRASQRTQEEVVKASFEKNQATLVGALEQRLITQNEFNERFLRLEVDRDTQLEELKREKEKESLELSRERREKELRDIEERYEEELRILQGFGSRKEQVEAELEERVFAFKTRNTGAMQTHLAGFSNWQVRTESERVNAVVGLGEFGFKQFAGQSKKAFALYKAFSITKALVNTYEMATGAYNALVNIPYVGPTLATAAAIAAGAYGLNQVNQIRGQQYNAVFDGGVDFVPREQTIARLTKGERVVSPRQNVALTEAVEKINKNEGVGSGISIVYSPKIVLENGNDESFDKARQLEQELYQGFEQRLVLRLRTGTGNFYNAVRQVA